MRAHNNDCPKPEECACQTQQYCFCLEEKKYLGEGPSYSEVYLHKCKLCDKYLLELYYVNEGFSQSGQWYTGFITKEMAKDIGPMEAIEILGSLPWYFCGGSFYGGKVNIKSGKIVLTP